MFINLENLHIFQSQIMFARLCFDSKSNLGVKLKMNGKAMVLL